MTMGDETLFAAMALPVVIAPILEQLEYKDMAAAATLKAAFAKVENSYPGFSYDLVKGLLEEGAVKDLIDMRETLLRLGGANNTDDFRVARTEDAFQSLNVRATNLKQILSRIPEEINERKKFLETIKDIASAIKNLLDAVSQVFVYIDGRRNKEELEKRKREFVKYSKKFSTTLKDFFKDSLRHEVFLSAIYLVHQTNLIMRTVKEAADLA